MVAVGLPLNVSPSLEFRELNFGVVIVVHLGLKKIIQPTIFHSFQKFVWYVLFSLLLRNLIVDFPAVLMRRYFSGLLPHVFHLGSFLSLSLVDSLDCFFFFSLFSLPSFTYHCNDLFLGCIVLYLHPLVMASSEGGTALFTFPCN